MTLAEILIIGVALSMDAFAVCLSSSMIYPGIGRLQKLSMPVMFGIFQGIMPTAGFFFGGLFGNVIHKYGGYVACAILVIIGINMIRECISGDDEEKRHFTFAVLMLQAVSTSIDAFATGVSFAAVGANIFYASGIIAMSTFVICLAALFIGSRLGHILGKYGGVLGGAVLILIGIKSVFG